jgi:cell division protein FtsQ
MVVLASIVVATSGWVALGSGALDVHRVDVRGTSALSTDAVDAIVAGAVGDPMLTVDTSGLRERIAAVPAVASVEVARSWPTTLHVQVRERRAVAAVRQPDGWLLVDATGVPFTTAALRPDRALRLDVDEPAIDDPSTQAALAVVDALPPRLRHLVVSVSAPSPDGVRLALRHDRVVVWGGAVDTRRKVIALTALLRTKASRDEHHYDVSTPGIVTSS